MASKDDDARQRGIDAGRGAREKYDRRPGFGRAADEVLGTTERDLAKKSSTDEEFRKGVDDGFYEKDKK